MSLERSPHYKRHSVYRTRPRFYQWLNAARTESNIPRRLMVVYDGKGNTLEVHASDSPISRLLSEPRYERMSRLPTVTITVPEYERLLTLPNTTLPEQETNA